MLVMTCDRCGETIPTNGDVNGRVRLELSHKKLTVDLCGPCQAMVYTDLVAAIEKWKPK